MKNVVQSKIPPDFDPDIVTGVRQRLDNSRNTGVTILFAIESGSRAWGFPSPDSDYDCRFVYVRPVIDHLTLEKQRDVIEFPIEGDLDVGGWDLRKALLLALGGNAVIGEWVDSAICYEEVEGVRSDLKSVLEQIVEPVRVSHHYLGLARSGLAKHNPSSGEIKLKKLFYILRPLIALQWMQQFEFSKLPPMDFNKSLREIEVNSDVRESIAELLVEKAKTRELGIGVTPAVILNFINSQFAFFQDNVPTIVHDSGCKQERFKIAQTYYEKTVTSFEM